MPHLKFRHSEGTTTFSIYNLYPKGDEISIEVFITSLRYNIA